MGSGRNQRMACFRAGLVTLLVNVEGIFPIVWKSPLRFLFRTNYCSFNRGARDDLLGSTCKISDLIRVEEPVPHACIIILRCFDLEGTQVSAWPSPNYGFKFISVLGPATLAWL